MNKLHLVAALAVIIVGSMTSIPTADAQAYCPMDNPQCCPDNEKPYCGLVITDGIMAECPFCVSQFDTFVYQGILIQDYRTIQLLEIVQVQGAQIVNLQKEIDSMKGAIITHGDAMGAVITEGRTFGVTTNWMSGAIITDGIIIGLVGIALIVGIVNLRRPR